MKNPNNAVEMVGSLENNLRLVYERDKLKLYEASITVKRLSGAEDCLIITVPERLYEQVNAAVNRRVRITGHIHTYSKTSDGKRRLMVSIWAESVEAATQDLPDVNIVRLAGNLHHDPVCRTTPLGRHISDMLLKVKDDDGMYHAIPCIAWGKNAWDTHWIHAGDGIAISGRLQSRQYEKQLPGGITIIRTTYEVSIRDMVHDDARNDERKTG